MSNCKESLKPIPVMCVIKDKKANIYTAPMTFANEECACRWFESLANKGDVSVCDYDLYLMGHYNESLGQLYPLNENALYLLMSGDVFKTRLDIIEKLKQERDYFKEQNSFKSTINDKLVDLIKTKFDADFSFEKFID